MSRPRTSYVPFQFQQGCCCCCCCRGTSSALNGCINDAHCMMFLLKSRFQFQDSDFRVLTDDQASPSNWPTRQNLMEGFRWLTQDARPGDSLVFHYSGIPVNHQSCQLPLAFQVPHDCKAGLQMAHTACCALVSQNVYKAACIIDQDDYTGKPDASQ